jgi:methyl-accepting chemotaxis protein
MKSENKLQGKSIPLRLRFRSPTDQLQLERPITTFVSITESKTSPGESQATPNNNSNGHDQTAQLFNTDPLMPANTPNARATDTSSSQYIFQVKELLHLSTLLRADLNLHDVLAHIASSTTSCTGFRAAVIVLIEGTPPSVKPVAFAGLSEEERQTILDHPISLDQLQRMMLAEFRISQSYFVPHNYVVSDLSDVVRIVKDIPISEDVNRWHPEDMLIVPLFSSREHEMLGFLSLDDPEDGLIPGLERIEMIELFANQAALAIDNARVFQQQKAERDALEQGIAEFREALKRIRHGDLVTPVASATAHPSLQPLMHDLHLIQQEACVLLGNMKMVVEAVDEHTHSMQRASELLVRDTHLQERQVQRISDVIHTMATAMHQISERAADLSKRAVEAMEVTMQGQGDVDRAVDGMSKVREATMRSSYILKRLSESGEEINETLLGLSDLTTRLHLLALNAAIEAARAGEHGQSFEIIAREIRALASTSTGIAHKIETYIHTVRHESIAVAQSVEQNMHQVIMQTELVTQTGVTLEAISNVTEQMATLVQGVCDTAEEQNQGSQVVIGTVTDILGMTGEITQHMQEMQESLAHLVELTNALRSRMSTFRIAELYE